MPIDAICPSCARPHRVANDVLGKRIRCKKCSTPFVVTGLDELPVANTPASPPPAPVETTKPKPASKPVQRPQPQAPQPSRGILDAPPQLEDLQGLEELEPASNADFDFEPLPAAATANHPPCPGCGKPFPHANNVCIACGFTRSTGNRPTTQVEAAPPVPAPSGLTRGLTRGLASNIREDDFAPHENPMLATFEATLTMLGPFLLAAYVIGSIIWMWVDAGVFKTKTLPNGYTLPAKFTVLIVFAALINVLVPAAVSCIMTYIGVINGRKVLKCSIPDDTFSRTIAVNMVALTVAAIAFLPYALNPPRNYMFGLSLSQEFSLWNLKSCMSVGAVMLMFLVGLPAHFGAYILAFRIRKAHQYPSYIIVAVSFLASIFLIWFLLWLVNTKYFEPTIDQWAKDEVKEVLKSRGITR